MSGTDHSRIIKHGRHYGLPFVAGQRGRILNSVKTPKITHFPVWGLVAFNLGREVLLLFPKHCCSTNIWLGWEGSHNIELSSNKDPAEITRILCIFRLSKDVCLDFHWKLVLVSGMRIAEVEKKTVLCFIS